MATLSSRHWILKSINLSTVHMVKRGQHTNFSRNKQICKALKDNNFSDSV